MNEIKDPAKSVGKIHGARELSQGEIDAINAINQKAEEVAMLVEELQASSADGRLVAIGKTDLEKGFMALVNSISKPVSKDELMSNGEKYRGQGISFRPPYTSEVVKLDDWLDAQASDHTSAQPVQG